MKIKSKLAEAVLEALKEPDVKKEGKYKRKKRSFGWKMDRWVSGDSRGGGVQQHRDLKGRWD